MNTRVIALATPVGLGISAAEAVMPPWVYQQAREQATSHVQVKVTRVDSPAMTPGECETTGEVVRIFLRIANINALRRVVRPRGAPDELRQTRVVAGHRHRLPKEGFQVERDDLVEHGVLGVSGPVDRALEGHSPKVGSRRRPGQC